MKVHFIGEKGVSMARLKELTARLGHSVSGSDECTTGHNESNVVGADMVVFSGAVKDDNCELSFARKKGIASVERSEYLWAIASGYDQVIGVAGSHGKTTVTAMIARVLAGFSPTVHIGANYDYEKKEKDKIFITEACEYRKSLLALSPYLGVVLNAELDHTDCYKSADEIAQTFAIYAHKCKTVLYFGDDRLLKKYMRTNAYTFGFDKSNDFYAVILNGEKENAFDFYAFKKKVGKVKLGVKGEHNALNALCALGVGTLYGVEFSKMAQALGDFKGVSRRQEFLGVVNGASVYTDYAHHPTEIKATLKALKGKSRLIAVFEPHTYTRTRDLFSEFSSAFTLADEVIIAPVFGSREKGGEVGSEELTEEIARRQKARFLLSYDKINEYIKKVTQKGDVVVYLGAGTIDKCARYLVKEKER